MAKILDQFGNPIETRTLAENQTDQVAKIGGLHNIFSTHPTRGLTPAKLARIMESAEQGDIMAQHDLFLDMEEKDGHIFSEMSKRKRALLTLDWSIEPPSKASAAEKKQAEYANEVLRDMDNFEDILLDMLDAIGHGFSCLEIEWEMLGKEWVPKQLQHRPQNWFQLDRETKSRIKLRDNSLNGAELWPFGWVTHVHKAKSGYLARSGLHRVLAWPFLFKNYSVRDLAEFLEIYGLPLRLGTYPSGAGDDEKATLLRAVASIGHDAAGIIPEGMMIDFKEAAKGGSDPFQYMIEWAERTQSKAILGGTLTSQADGKSSTNALGNVHNEVRHDLLIGDAAQVASTLTRDLIYPIIALNLGGVTDRRRLPRFRFDTVEAEDIKVLAESLPNLVDVGVRIPVSWANEKLRIPIPTNDEPILGRHKEAPAVIKDAKATAALSANVDNIVDDNFPDQAALDALIDGISDAELQQQMEGILKPVLDLIAASSDYETVLGKLAELYPEMDSKRLEDWMARAWYASASWGVISKQDEDNA